MLSPEDQRTQEFRASVAKELGLLRSGIQSLVAFLKPINKAKYSVSSTGSATQEHHEPKPELSIGSIAEFWDAYKSEHKASEASRKDFERRYLRVQWFLFFATLAAFGAALYYAITAKKQAQIASDQTFIMGLAVGQTQHILGQAITQTEAAKRSADAAVQAAHAARDSVVESRKNRISSEAQNKTVLEANAANSKDQSSLMKDQIKTMRQQLDSGERPWMKVNLALLNDPTSPFASVSIDQSDRSLVVIFTVEGINVGRSPTVNVRGRSLLIPTPTLTGAKGVEKSQQELCDSIPGMVNLFGAGDTVFPGDPYRLDQRLVAPRKVIDSELASPSNTVWVLPNGKRLVIVSDDPMDGSGLGIAMGKVLKANSAPTFSVIGCIDYSIDYSNTRHQTMFMYELIGVDLRLNDVHNASFQKSFGWGNIAN